MAAMKNKTRVTQKVNQGHLFPGLKSAETRSAGKRPKFVKPDPKRLFLGMTRLDAYLENIGATDVLALAKALEALDWTRFEELYAGAGRPSYSPRLMAGLIMYGIAQGRTSLRELEALACRDVGCMWVCGGIQPDHSNIGRFILRHAEAFEGSFFADVTVLALKATGSDASRVAGDGTVIQAAGSRYRTLKKEALEAKLKLAEQEASASPDDSAKHERQQKYAQAGEALSERMTARAKQRKASETLRVCTTEPEAPVQKMKNGGFAASYHASALANEKRIIVAADVQSSDEAKSIPPMLDEAEAITGKNVEELLADGNYCNKEVIAETLDRGVGLLTPIGDRDPVYNGKFGKGQFAFDESQNTYTCPAGHLLTPQRRSQAEDSVTYSTKACLSCPLRSKCISSADPKATRIVKRYGVDQHKDALREVMSQPRAQAAYKQRKAMIEPVFGFMKEQMGITRFRRRGLRNARLEFKLYAAAYNLTRALVAALPSLEPVWASLVIEIVLQIFVAAKAASAIRLQGFRLDPLRRAPFSLCAA